RVADGVSARPGPTPNRCASDGKSFPRLRFGLVSSARGGDSFLPPPRLTLRSVPTGRRTESRLPGISYLCRPGPKLTLRPCTTVPMLGSVYAYRCCGTRGPARAAAGGGVARRRRRNAGDVSGKGGGDRAVLARPVGARREGRLPRLEGPRQDDGQGRRDGE